MRYTSSAVGAPVYEGGEDIKFIPVTEEMEALLILEMYFRGVGEAGWSLSESRIVCVQLEYPHTWMFPRPHRLQEVSEAPVLALLNPPCVWEIVPTAPPLVHQPFVNPPLPIFYPPGRWSESLQAD